MLNSTQPLTSDTSNKVTHAKYYFDKIGYSNPYSLSHSECINSLLAKLEQEKQTVTRPRSIGRKLKLLLKRRKNWAQDIQFNLKDGKRNRHLDFLEVQKIIHDPNLKSILRELCGPDLILWRTELFIKGQGVGEIGWHHDKHFQDGNEPLIDLEDVSSHFTVLVALNDMTLFNGALEVLPLSHKPLAGLKRNLNAFSEKQLSTHFTRMPWKFQNKTIPITFEQGYFFVFHSGLLHRSKEHISGEHRISLAMRLMRKGIQFPTEKYSNISSENFISL